jgi:hypothetical protein
VLESTSRLTAVKAPAPGRASSVPTPTAGEARSR